jgi:CheY-like chemotaxis protein
LGFKFRVLLVDDDPSILQTGAALLASKGYEVLTAADGFLALIQLRQSLPDVIISDLKMPNMSGFELLSVIRRRFPHIPVVAMSGEYNGTNPQGLIADAFFTKGHYTPEALFTRIAELLESPVRPHLAKPDKAPVWIPKNDAGYLVVTCTECLRSFSVPDDAEGEVREVDCVFCDSKVCYLADVHKLRKFPRSI